MTTIRFITRQLSTLLDADIQKEYDQRGRVNSSQLVCDLRERGDYAPLLQTAAPVVVYSWFALLVRDRLQRAALGDNTQQMSLELPGWKHIDLRGAFCTQDDSGGVCYVRMPDMLREDFVLADRLLTRQIENDSKSRRALRRQNDRLEPLRAIYGDLKVNELIARALEDGQDATGSSAEPPQPAA